MKLVREKIELKAKIKSKEIDLTLKQKEYDDFKVIIDKQKVEIELIRNQRQSRLKTLQMNKEFKEENEKF